jgi:hypothetical protein
MNFGKPEAFNSVFFAVAGTDTVTETLFSG